MIESEAAEMLKAYYVCQQMQVKGIYEDCNSNKCDNCDLRYKQGNNGERIESTKMAIQALEKQIPKKVQEKHIDEYICPACGEENSGCDEGKITDRYCPKCGQRLGVKNETD